MHIECEQCGAGLQLAAQQRTTTCPYCASPQVIERPAAPNRPNPSFTLGFVINREGARAALHRWYRAQAWRFRRSDLHRAPIEKMQGVYAPAYLYNVVARSDYHASIAEEYYVTVSYTTTVNGRTVTRTRRERRLEWHQLNGQHATYVPDVLVTASRGISNEELEELEPFDLGSMCRYSAGLISGWIAEDPTMTVEQCVELARKEAIADVGGKLKHFMPGCEHKNLQYRTWLEQEAIDLVLVPVWALAVRYDPQKPAMRVFINGQTGEVVGKAPISWIKISILAVVVAALIGALLMFVNW